MEKRGSKAAAGRIRLFLVRFAAPALVVGLLASAVQAQDDDLVKAGLATWRNSGCADCHGAFADGEKQRGEMPTGANLRTRGLDPVALKRTINCDRPGMPSFDEGA